MTGGSSSAAIAFDARDEHVLSFGIDFFLQKHDLKTGRTVDRLSIRPAGVEFEEAENGVPKFDAEQRFFSLSGAVFDDARTTLFIGLQKAVVGCSVVDGKESFRFVSDHTVDRFAVSPDGGNRRQSMLTAIAASGHCRGRFRRATGLITIDAFSCPATKPPS